MSPFPNRLAPQWHHRAVRRHQTHRSGTEHRDSVSGADTGQCGSMPAGREMSDSMTGSGTSAGSSTVVRAATQVS